MKESEKRYQQILNRSFKGDVELFLFEKLFSIVDDEKILKEDYINFVRTKELEEIYSIAFQLSKYDDTIEYKGLKKSAKQMDDFYNDWFKNTKVVEEFKEIFKSNRFIKSEDFESLYDNGGKERACCYCGISESKIKDFIQRHAFRTKRLSTRGRALEVDRIDPNGGYDKSNIVLCCYWCNNAKTDEFTFEEFKPIGHVISEIWKKRS
jgi:hypothetical protein